MSIPSERPSRTVYLALALRGCGAWLLGGSAFAQALDSGGVARGSLSAPGERDTYTFDAARGFRGDWFEMRLVDVSGSFTPQLELYNPRGVLIRTSSSPDVAVIDTTEVVAGVLSATPPGTYTVVVSDGSSAHDQTGAYDLHFVRAPAAHAGLELVDGVTVFGEIEAGELDLFVFTTVAGQPLEGTVTDLFGGTLRMRVETFTAGGSSEGIGGTVHFTGTGQGDTRTLVVSDGSSTATGTGRYSIVFHGLATTPPSSPNVFWPSELQSDPLLLDNAGSSGLGPWIGDPTEPFNVAIDCTGADSPSFYALSLSLFAPSASSTPWGRLYLNGPTLFRKVGGHTRSIETWYPEPSGLLLPSDSSLVGLSYTVQGVAGGFGGSARLSGAITQTIGG